MLFIQVGGKKLRVQQGLLCDKTQHFPLLEVLAACSLAGLTYLFFSFFSHSLSMVAAPRVHLTIADRREPHLKIVFSCVYAIWRNVYAFFRVYLSSLLSFPILTPPSNPPNAVFTLTHMLFQQSLVAKDYACRHRWRYASPAHARTHTHTHFFISLSIFD